MVPSAILQNTFDQEYSVSSFAHFVTSMEQLLPSLYHVECNSSCYNQNKSDFRVLTARTKAKTKERSNFLFLIRKREVCRYTVLGFVGVRTEYIGKGLLARRRKATWFMQTNNQTLLCHSSSNKTKRASCYIVQQDMKWLLYSRRSPFPSSSSKEELFGLSVFTRQK